MALNRTPQALLLAALVVALTGCALLVQLGEPQSSEVYAGFDPFGFADELVNDSRSTP